MAERISAMNDIHQKNYMFLQDNFVFRPKLFSLADTASLRDAGVIETADIPELVAFLEAEFRIAVTSNEIAPTDLDSIKAIVSFVEAKLAASAGLSNARRFSGFGAVA
jgi:hypothetical protein